MSCNSSCCGLDGAASSCDLDGSSSNLRWCVEILRAHNARDDPEAPEGLLQAANNLRESYLENANDELDLISKQFRIVCRTGPGRRKKKQKGANLSKADRDRDFYADWGVTCDVCNNDKILSLDTS